MSYRDPVTNAYFNAWDRSAEFVGGVLAEPGSTIESPGRSKVPSWMSALYLENLVATILSHRVWPWSDGWRRIHLQT